MLEQTQQMPGRQKIVKPLLIGLQRLPKLIVRKLVARRTDLLLLVVYGVLALGLLAPSASSVKILPDEYDLQPHLGLIIQARMALEEGQFPLRIAPWEFDGWRYPTYQYYGQLPHTLGALLYEYLTPDNPYNAYLIVVWLSLLVGAFYIYLTGLWLTRSRIGAALAGMLYIASPYFLINIHSRGALAEIVGQGVLPVAFYYALRSYAKRSLLTVLLSGLSWFLLISAHTITFVNASLFIGLLFIIIAFPRLRTRKTQIRLMRVALGYILGWMLAAYYLGPVILQQRGLYIQYSLSDPYYANNLTPVPGLLSPTSVPPYPGFVDSPGLNPAVGWPMLVSWGVVLYYYLNLGKTRLWPVSLQRTNRYIGVLLGLFLLAFFMTWSPVDFWKFLPVQLQVSQFSYRLLAQLAWIGALLVPYALVLLIRKLEAIHFVIGLLIISFAASSYLPPPKPATATIGSLVKAPDIGYGRVSYLYEPQVTELYANEELPLYGGGSSLALNQDFTLPSWPNEAKPVFHLKSNVTFTNNQSAAILRVLINGQKIGEVPLSAGPFNWDLPLEKAQLPDKSFVIRFETEPQTSVQLQVIALNLSGLPPDQTLIGLSETQPVFHQQGKQTVGQITIKENFPRMVQLPVLYYPNLLEVKVDGKKVDYGGLPNWIFTMVGVKLSPGTHEVSVEFVGLGWANIMSLLAWLLLLVGLLICLFVLLLKIGRAEK